MWCGGGESGARRGGGVNGSSDNGWRWWGGGYGVIIDIIECNINNYINNGGGGVGLGCGYAQNIRALP